MTMPLPVVVTAAMAVAAVVAAITVVKGMAQCVQLKIGLTHVY